MRPELRLLSYFVAVAEERHFGRAAERLGMAQPPLSQQIRKLETQLGAQLFDRSCRPIELTDAGRALLEEVRLAISHSDRAFAAARRAAAGQVGHLRIGAMQAALNGVVPFIMRAFRQEQPDTRLELVEESKADQISQLLEDRLDVGFVRAPVDEPSLFMATVTEDPFVAVFPDDHPLAHTDLLPVGSLWDEPLILWERSAAPTAFADVVQLFRDYGIQPPVVEEADRIQTVLALVAAGIGTALLPASFANLNRRGVRFVRLRPPVPHRPIVLTWRAKSPAATLQSFIDVAIRVGTTYDNELGPLKDQ